MRHQLPMGVLLYIIVADEVLPLTQNHQSKKKTNFQKATNFAPENNRTLTTKTISYTSIQPQIVTNGGTSLFQAFKDHSTLQPWQLFRSLGRPLGNFFERKQN